MAGSFSSKAGSLLSVGLKFGVGAGECAGGVVAVLLRAAEYTLPSEAVLSVAFTGEVCSDLRLPPAIKASKAFDAMIPALLVLSVLDRAAFFCHISAIRCARTESAIKSKTEAMQHADLTHVTFSTNFPFVECFFCHFFDV